MKHPPDQTNTSDPVIEAYKKHIDRTLLQRFRQLMELQRFAEELQNAGRKARQKQCGCNCHTTW